MSIQPEPNCTASWVERVKSGTDAYGNDTYTETPVQVEAVFAPGGSSETITTGDRVVTQPAVFLPAPAPSAVDEIEVDGVPYEVDGQPADYSVGSPFGGWVPDFPVVVRLKQVTG